MQDTRKGRKDARQTRVIQQRDQKIQQNMQDKTQTKRGKDTQKKEKTQEREDTKERIQERHRGRQDQRHNKEEENIQQREGSHITLCLTLRPHRVILKAIEAVFYGVKSRHKVTGCLSFLSSLSLCCVFSSLSCHLLFSSLSCSSSFLYLFLSSSVSVHPYLFYFFLLFLAIM